MSHRTRAQQRAFEQRADQRTLRNAAHAAALRIEVKPGFEGVDIDRIHQVWREREREAA